MCLLGMERWPIRELHCLYKSTVSLTCLGLWKLLFFLLATRRSSKFEYCIGTAIEVSNWWYGSKELRQWTHIFVISLISNPHRIPDASACLVVCQTVYLLLFVILLRVALGKILYCVWITDVRMCHTAYLKVYNLHVFEKHKTYTVIMYLIMMK